MSLSNTSHGPRNAAILIALAVLALTLLTTCSRQPPSPPPPPPVPRVDLPPEPAPGKTGSIKPPPRDSPPRTSLPETAPPGGDIPMFPWPPPAASATQVLSRDFFRDSPADLGAVDAILSRALDARGYLEKRYYGVPDGFALITRIEQIHPDGASSPEPARWSVEPPRFRPLSFSDYIKALFTADPGFYRVIAFVVTATPFGQSPERMTSAQVKELFTAGLNVLPPVLAEIPYTPRTACTALIYEFRKPDRTEPARPLVPGALGASIHLTRSGLIEALTRQIP